MRCVKRFGDTLRHVTGRKRHRVCLRSDGWGVEIHFMIFATFGRGRYSERSFLRAPVWGS